MGILVTLYLMSINIYLRLKAPSTRGFSYIEIWTVGTQSTIVFAIFEYGIILAWKKYSNTAKVDSNFIIDQKIKTIDLFSLIISIVFFVIFNVFYWA